MNQKGVITIPETGYIEVIAFTGNAQIPLPNVAVTVTATDQTALAMRLTDRNGRISPVEIPVPELSAGLTPNTGIVPYTPVNVYARLEGFEQIENEDLQVFPNTATRLELRMIPLAELPAYWDQTVVFKTPSQNL